MTQKKGKERQVEEESPEPVPEQKDSDFRDDGIDSMHLDFSRLTFADNDRRVEAAITHETFIRSAPLSPQSPASRQRFEAYCVFNGRTNGVFRTWHATQVQVSGFSGSRYQGYRTVEAAQHAWDHAVAIGCIGPPQPPTSCAGPSTAPAPPQHPGPSTPYLQASSSHAPMGSPYPRGPHASYFVVIHGDYPGVYHTNESAVNAMGDNPSSYRIQVASMAQGDAIFRQEYMKGNIVSFRNA